MDRQDVLSYLSSSGILAKASEEALLKYFTDDALSLTDFRAGEVIYSRNSDGRYVGIIISGKVAAEPVGAKDNALLRIMGAGDMFGVANLYCEEPFPSVIVAKTSARVLFITADAFCSLIEHDKNAMRAYLRFMSNRIVYLNKKISTLTAGTAEKKLAAYLAKNASTENKLSSVSMSALAELLGVGRASLYRALDQLEEQKLISRDGKEIIITDKNALLSYI